MNKNRWDPDSVFTICPATRSRDMQQLRQILEHMAAGFGAMAPMPEGYAFNSIYAYVASEGQTYTIQPFTDEEQALVDAIRYREVKQCFANCQQVVLDNLLGRDAAEHFEYVEGFCLSSRIPFPIHHAWLALNGKVVDPTLRVPASEFIGVQFDREVIRAYVLKHHEWATLIDNYRDQWPLLQEKE